MTHRLDSYCGITYVDTEAESLDGRIPVGPHPYEVCLEEQRQRRSLLMGEVSKIEGNIKQLVVKIRDRGFTMKTVTGRLTSSRSNIREIDREL